VVATVLAAQVRDRAWNDIRCYGELASAHCHQSESGLNYNYFRDYDPQVGRYVESDPIGLKAGNNTYTYVSDKPVAFGDSLGLDPCYVIGYRRTPWEEIPGSAGTPWYELMPDIVENPVIPSSVTCSWRMLQLAQERRDVYVEMHCFECDHPGCVNACHWVNREKKTGIETQPRLDVTKGIGPGYGMVFNDGNPEEANGGFCRNPWTGELKPWRSP
jgi:RHS repeat-associated protein